ncbi:MAG: hypothetical protein KGL39_31400 [Patescibacteria group bacterium]|nr:hypothetical protein [Patescibacteria group bacterium]
MILPKNSKDVPALRNFLTTLRAQACASSEAFSPSLKEMAGELTKKLDGLISELPKEDADGDWDLSNKLDSLFALLAQASALASMAGMELAKLKAETTETATQLAGAVEAAIQSKVTAGELLTKDAHTAALAAAVKTEKDTVGQLCAEAKKNGIAEGEKKVRDEISAAEAVRAQIAGRRTELQKAGKPLPEAEFESVLGGTEEQFKAVTDKYDARLAALNKAGVQLAGSPLLSKLYLPDSDYKTFEATVTSIDALKTPPVEVAGGADAAPPGKAPLIMIV